MKKSKPPAKYYFDQAKWGIKKTFAVDKETPSMGFCMAVFIMSGVTVFNLLPAYEAPVEAEFDKTPITAQYQDHLDQNIIPPLSEASASLKQAERTLHIAKFDEKDVGAAKLAVDTAKLKYDYEADKAFLSVVNNPKMTEIGLKSFMDTYLNQNVKYQYLDAEQRDECLVDPKYKDIQICMKQDQYETANQVFAFGFKVSASLFLTAFIFGFVGLVVSQGNLEIRPGPKPKRKDYIKLGN